MDCSSVVSKGNADNKLKNMLGIVFMLTRMKKFQLRVLECCCPPSPLGGLFFHKCLIQKGLDRLERNEVLLFSWQHLLGMEGKQESVKPSECCFVLQFT